MAKLQKISKQVLSRLNNLTYLETIGIVAIVILLVNMLFEIDMTVNKKPWLQKLANGKASQTLPPRLSNGNTQPSQTTSQQSQQSATPADPALIAEVMPSAGVELPATWGDLGKQLVKSGVIDQQKFEALYAQQGGLTTEMKKMLLTNDNGKIKITSENSGIILNLLWALGLGNKNAILDKGEMQDPKYGGADRFASTGGWTLATGKVMDHYSKHEFIRLTSEQQALVDRVSKNIYRPCCGNSTHFPDCNHGMAMLALLELMASQGVNEQDMYKVALTVNSYWFPNNYLTIAAYFKKQGTDWANVSPQTALSAEYSSSQGYQQLLNKTTPQQAPQSKSGCGV